jgi:hypothetical protein
VSAAFDASTLSFVITLAAAPSNEVSYNITVNDETGSDGGGKRVSATLGSNGGIWSEQAGGQTRTPISSGATITANGSTIIFTITKETWATVIGHQPLGGEIRVTSLVNGTASYWSRVKDLLPRAYFKLPAN